MQIGIIEKLSAQKNKFYIERIMTEDNKIPRLQDSRYHVNLSNLSNLNYVTPTFKPLDTFLISSFVYLGDTATISRGKAANAPAIIETCIRVPFRLVCREISYLQDNLNKINNIVKIKTLTRNQALGVVSIAYEDFDFVPWETPIPTDKLIPLFEILLTTLSAIHSLKFSHGCICRSSIFISPDFTKLTLGCFHAAVKSGDIVAFTYDHPCMPQNKSKTDPRKDDVYSAAFWFLSYFNDNPYDALKNIEKLQLPKEIVSVLQQLTAEKENERLDAEKAAQLVSEYLKKPSE